MDSSKKLYVALALLLGLGAGLYVQTQKQQEEAQAYTLEAKLAELPKLDVDEETRNAIDTIELTLPPDDKANEAADAGAGHPQSAERVVLTKKGEEEWALTAPLSYTANFSNVKSLLDNLEKLKITEQISASTDSYARWGVTDDKALRAVFKKGSEVVADLYFGDNGSRGQMTRLANHDGVYAMQGYSKYLYERDAKGWRDKSIFKFDEKEVERVVVQNENGTFTFERKDDAWTGRFGKVAPGAEFERFKSSKVDDLLRAYKNLNASDFGDNKTVEDVGLDKPVATVTIELKGGNDSRVLQVGDSAENNARWVKANTSDTLFTISSWSADWATAELSKFQEKKSED